VLLPQGTLVRYATYTFTDHVAGLGGSMKGNSARRMMTSKLEAPFKKARSELRP